MWRIYDVTRSNYLKKKVQLRLVLKSKWMRSKGDSKILLISKQIGSEQMRPREKKIKKDVYKWGQKC